MNNLSIFAVLKIMDMEEKVVIINTYKLEKLLEESLEEAFKRVEEELKDYNWDFIPEYMKIDSNE